jgi:hypothetical protein
MRFALLCEEFHKSKDIRSFIDQIPSHHTLVVLKVEDVLEGRFVGDYDMFFVNKRSWQSAASIFRYFGKLSMFDSMNLCVVTRGKKNPQLKNRAARKDLQFSLPIQAEHFDKTIEGLLQSSDRPENRVRS